MIAPLSLSFSGDFADLRGLLYKRYKKNWFSHFARIPAALFAADVRVRNTIHIGSFSGTDYAQLTTRLHRWFEIARPNLFSTLSYSGFNPTLWHGRIPKLNTHALITAFENLLRPGARTVEASLSRRVTAHKLNFKKTAYNWLSFTHDEAPCFDERGKRVPQTKYGAVFFENSEQRDISFFLLNGKLEFAFWVAIGDDFDVTKWMFSDLPIDIGRISDGTRKELLALLPEMKATVEEAVQYKLNAGKRVGNYNLAKCREITDRADAILVNAFGLAPVWDDVELLYTQIVKTNFESDDDED
jgi:hypothetical protein